MYGDTFSRLSLGRGVTRARKCTDPFEVEEEVRKHGLKASPLIVETVDGRSYIITDPPNKLSQKAIEDFMREREALQERLCVSTTDESDIGKAVSEAYEDANRVMKGRTHSWRRVHLRLKKTWSVSTCGSLAFYRLFGSSALAQEGD